MAEHLLPTLEGIRYIPRRLQTPAAGFRINDLVEHFIKCGLRPRDAEMIFRDFASHYLAHILQAAEPNWSKMSPPPALTSRCTVKERVKLRRKEFKATCMESQSAEAQHEQRARELAPAQTTNTQAVSQPPVVSHPAPSQTTDGPKPETGDDISMESGSPAE
jgi:hypothetical protein